MTFISIGKFLLMSCLIVTMSKSVIEETLLEDFETFLVRWDIKYLSIIYDQLPEHIDGFTDFDSPAVKLISAYKELLKGIRVNVMWSYDRIHYGIDISEGAFLYLFSKNEPASYIAKLIAKSSSNRPLFLYSLGDASLPTWLRTTRIPFSSNVYVILQDAQQPGTLTLQGVYHLHEESKQLTVDLVGRRMLQGPTNRWTFFGLKYNTKRRSDLHGIKIRTVIPKVMFDTTNHGIASFYRATEPLVHLLMEALNASLVPVFLDKAPNVGYRNSSGAWNGMIGMLHRRDADFSLVGTEASAAILEPIGVTCPFVGQVFRLFIRKPEFTYSLSTCFKGFTAPMWLASGLTSILLATFSSISNRIAIRFNSDIVSDNPDLSECMLQTIGTCCLQGWGRLNETMASYLICLSTLVFGYLLNLYYVSQLQAAITAKIAPLPFKDLEGLLDNGIYIPGINRGTTPYIIAQSATNGTMKRVRDLIRSRPKDVLIGSLPSSVQRLCTEKLALISWKIHINPELRKSAECTIVDTKKSMFPIFVAFGVVKGFPYTHILNLFIRRLAEGGVVNLLITDRLTRVENGESPFVVIELVDVIPFLILYAGALAVSLAILILEISVSAWSHRKYQRKHPHRSRFGKIIDSFQIRLNITGCKSK